MIALFQDEGSRSWLDTVAGVFIKPGMIDEPGAHGTAVSWMMTGLVIAVLLTGAMVLLKWLLKERAAIKQKRWPLSKVFGYMAVGLFPAFAVLLGVYYLSLDFITMLGPQGFFKGVVFAWLVYLIAMVVNDLIWQWSRTDYGLR